ncbi:MAG: NERD domain-containing protein [Syntrophaceae bacterium]|nr:NERD domain-containing protein [Syntrophaceae bacterium]
MFCLHLPEASFGELDPQKLKNGYRYRLRTNQNQGEASVYNIIKNNFPAPQYHLLNNITIPFQDGRTQIDHTSVSTKGMFVIETKNYSGWIFVDEKSKEWTQALYRVINRFKIQFIKIIFTSKLSKSYSIFLLKSIFIQRLYFLATANSKPRYLMMFII